MNLVIDLGNTFSKLAFFEADELIAFKSFNKNDFKAMENFVQSKKNIQAVITSSVVNHSPEYEDLFSGIKKQVIFSPQTKIPIKNFYKTIHTLGSDRLPTVIAANKMFPKTNVLVIDSGTCIKYNFITAFGEYLGGGISPGINMRFKALNQFTDRLPLVEANYNFKELVGKTSEESILSGVLIGVVAEVDGIINKYKEQYPNVKIVITGGDCSFFEKQLKNSIFADPFLVVKGLNIILNFNAEGKS